MLPGTAARSCDVTGKYRPALVSGSWQVGVFAAARVSAGFNTTLSTYACLEVSRTSAYGCISRRYRPRSRAHPKRVHYSAACRIGP